MALHQRLEDLDHRIAQYRREDQREERLRRRREALLTAHRDAHDHLEEMNLVLNLEEAKLGHGKVLFHRGHERRMVEDLVAVENLAVFKAAGQYTAVSQRLEDLEAEVSRINSALERRGDRSEHLAMLEEWREDLYSRTGREGRGRNVLLHRRLDAWLHVADREDDLEDLDAASSQLEEVLMALEAAIAAATRVRQVTKRDLAVIANLQPPRTRQFLLRETFRNCVSAYRHLGTLIDTLQGIEHLKVHIREPIRILDGLLEALLLDFYEGERPYHALREIHDHHKYLLQVRQAIRDRKEDVERELEELKLKEDQLLLMAIDRRLQTRTSLNRW